jgi:hypothetical protein
MEMKTIKYWKSNVIGLVQYVQTLFFLLAMFLLLSIVTFPSCVFYQSCDNS